MLLYRFPQAALNHEVTYPGTDQVDLDVATKRGVPVFNAPFSNTRSVAELTLAEIIMLARKVH